MASDPLAFLDDQETKSSDPLAFLDEKPAAAPAFMAGKGGGFDEDTDLAPIEKPKLVSPGSVAGAVGDGFKNLGRTVANAAPAAIDLVSPVSRDGGLQVPLGKLADPHYRRQLERGVSDVVTGGAAEKLANAASPEFAASAQEDASSAPGARELGAIGGMALPSPFNYLGGKAAGMVPGAGPLATAGRNLAAYEGMAVPQAATQAALSAPKGERLSSAGSAALDAATDPAGLALSVGVPALVRGGQEVVRSDSALAMRAKAIKSARERATKDMASEITSAEGPRATVTSQKRISEVGDRLFELTQDNPELHEIWGMPAKKALPKLKEIMREKIEPRQGLYDDMDAATVEGSPPGPGEKPPQGGIRLRDVVDGYRQAAVDAVDPAKGGGTFGEPDAARYNSRADQMLRVYGKPAPPKFNPDVVINADGMKAGEMIKILERRPNAPGIPEEIARIREQASTPGQVDLDARIPTIQFRKEVTESAKAAEQAMGGLNGGPRHEALDNLYRVGGDILNEHIDSSGLPPEKVDQLRKINDQYFLLKRAETAIEARGWKENNRPGFHLPHGVKAAVEGSSLAGMTAYGAMHPHAILPMAATYGAVKAAPKLAAKANWAIANLPETPAAPRTVSPVAIARLIQAGRQPGMTRAQLQAQADRDGVKPEIAANIAASNGF